MLFVVKTDEEIKNIPGKGIYVGYTSNGNVDCHHSIPYRRSLKRDGDSGELNDKDRCRSRANKAQFCVQYSDDRILIWTRRGNHSPPACIPYRHRGLAPGVMAWANNGYT
ncbi:hypothetical protein TNCV_271761 [Trichonephila clavipes]|nr:hypothetical protein TNCV_271761 [Trichonephila clavipes]